MNRGITMRVAMGQGKPTCEHWDAQFGCQAIDEFGDFAHGGYLVCNGRTDNGCMMKEQGV